MSRILRTAGAAALSLALLAPTAAHADRWSGTDEVGDVEGWQYDPEPEPCGTFTDLDGSAETNNDIVRLSVRHHRRAMVITTRFRALDPALEQMLFLYVRTSTGGWWLDLTRFEDAPGRWRVHTFLGAEPDLPDPDDIPDDQCGFGVIIHGEPCKIRRDVDFERDRIRLAVPRRCIDNPRWVRVGASAYRWVEPADPDHATSTSFHDDWDGGTELSPWMPPFGPRVRATAGADMGAARAAPAASGDRGAFVVRRDGIITRR